MTDQQKNEMIARWMGWTQKPEKAKGWKSQTFYWFSPNGQRTQTIPPNYTTDENAIGEVLERIRNIQNIDIVGRKGGWKANIQYGVSGKWFQTEQAAKVAAVLQFIQAQQ